MIVNRELNNLLNEYDSFHSMVNIENQLSFEFNFFEKKVSALLSLKSNEEKNENLYEEEFYLDREFSSYIFPKLVSRFISKNFTLKKRKIIGSNEKGSYIVENPETKEKLILRNSAYSYMDLIDSLERVSIYSKTNDNGKLDTTNFYDDDTLNYYVYNLAMDYAFYRKDFIDENSKANFFDVTHRRSFLEEENRNNENNLENLIILDVARYAYVIGIKSQYNVWEQIKEVYPDDKLIHRICDTFDKKDFKNDSVYEKALRCAEFEFINDGTIIGNLDVVTEALKAVSNGITIMDDKFQEYFDGQRRYYKLLDNEQFVKICNNFFNCIKFNDMKKGDGKVQKKESVISQIKAVKEKNRPSFSTIIHEPIGVRDVYSEPSINIVSGNENDGLEEEKLIDGAKEQAKMLMDVLKERDKIKKDAEEFAKIILKEQNERKKILKDAEEQAKRIFELERENEELRMLAEDNARSIIAYERRMEEEVRLREEVDNLPIPKSDIDKINNLLNSLSVVKELDFCVNHPTIGQEVNLLEEKIVTYLTTHKNIIHDVKAVDTSFIKDIDKKSPSELLSIIRNVYYNSHSFEKEGRHSVINIIPTTDNKYRVTIYSVKNDMDDILTDLYFDAYYFNEDVIKEICEIYKKDAVIIASKTDNIPTGKADYLVIDNQDNAIKFMECSKDIVTIAKAYL